MEPGGKGQQNLIHTELGDDVMNLLLDILIWNGIQNPMAILSKVFACFFFIAYAHFSLSGVCDYHIGLLQIRHG